MGASVRRAYNEPECSTPRSRPDKPVQLETLSALGSVEIQTNLLADLSRDLHTLFDPVSEGVLPIYFGPLLGRLYLEGL